MPFLFAAYTLSRARQQVSVLFLRWLSCRAGWLPLKSPRPAHCPAIFEMRVIEELKRNFELFPSLDCVQSRGVLPLAFMGENSGAPGRFATVMLGGVVFSTIAALTVLPVLVARIAE